MSGVDEMNLASRASEYTKGVEKEVSVFINSVYMQGYCDAEADRDKNNKALKERNEAIWEKRAYYHYCSKCKNVALKDDNGNERLTDFCPFCGSRMRK